MQVAPRLHTPGPSKKSDQANVKSDPKDLSNEQLRGMSAPKHVNALKWELSTPQERRSLLDVKAEHEPQGKGGLSEVRKAFKQDKGLFSEFRKAVKQNEARKEASSAIREAFNKVSDNPAQLKDQLTHPLKGRDESAGLSPDTKKLSDAQEAITTLKENASDHSAHHLARFAQQVAQNFQSQKPSDTASPADSGATLAAPQAQSEQNALNDITEQFQQRFADSAQNKEEFHALMKKTFGDQYDVSKAEAMRQQTLKGDFSWMPEIQLVDGEQLADLSGTQAGGVGKGAYSADRDTVYLSRDLLNSNPAEAEKILTEEVGHAIDAKINVNDAKGDEGDIFSRSVHGEEISNAELTELRQENDSGTIEINGEKVEVEYGWLSDAVDSAGDAFQENVIDPVKDAADDAGEFVQDYVIDPVVGVAEDVGDIVVNGWETVGDIGQSIFSGGKDFLGNLFEGDISGAWDALVDTGKDVFSEAAGYVVESTAMIVQSQFDFIDEVFGVKDQRKLSHQEEAYLRTIFGDSIDYDKVKIHSGSSTTDLLGIDPHAIGNDVYLPKENFNGDGSLNEKGMRLLGHEMAHVWQFQKGGAGYISEALAAQWFGDKYDVSKALDAGTSFVDMNPEQQARVAELIGVTISQKGELNIENFNEILFNGGGKNAGFGDYSTITAPQFAIILEAHRILQS